MLGGEGGGGGVGMGVGGVGGRGGGGVHVGPLWPTAYKALYSLFWMQANGDLYPTKYTVHLSLVILTLQTWSRRE